MGRSCVRRYKLHYSEHLSFVCLFASFYLYIDIYLRFMQVCFISMIHLNHLLDYFDICKMNASTCVCILALACVPFAAAAAAAGAGPLELLDGFIEMHEPQLTVEAARSMLAEMKLISQGGNTTPDAEKLMPILQDLSLLPAVVAHCDQEAAAVIGRCLAHSKMSPGVKRVARAVEFFRTKHAENCASALIEQISATEKTIDPKSTNKIDTCVVAIAKGDDITKRTSLGTQDGASLYWALFESARDDKNYSNIYYRYDRKGMHVFDETAARALFERQVEAPCNEYAGKMRAPIAAAQIDASGEAPKAYETDAYRAPAARQHLCELVREARQKLFMGFFSESTKNYRSMPDL